MQSHMGTRKRQNGFQVKIRSSVVKLWGRIEEGFFAELEIKEGSGFDF